MNFKEEIMVDKIRFSSDQVYEEAILRENESEFEGHISIRSGHRTSRVPDDALLDTFNRREERRFRSLNCLRSAFQVSEETNRYLLKSTNDSDTEDEDILPEETQWMLACSNGSINELKDLFQSFPHLLDHKDFVFGYTVLHWSSKLGRTDIIEFVSVNQTGTAYLDVKSHGGYTALHIASICGNDEVIVRLIELGANIHVRDNSGKKPKDLVKKTVAPSLQNKLGKPLVLDQNIVLETGLSLKSRHDAKSNRFSFRDDCSSPKASPIVQRRSSQPRGGVMVHWHHI